MICLKFQESFKLVPIIFFLVRIIEGDNIHKKQRFQTIFQQYLWKNMKIGCISVVKMPYKRMDQQNDCKFIEATLLQFKQLKLSLVLLFKTTILCYSKFEKWWQLNVLHPHFIHQQLIFLEAKLLYNQLCLFVRQYVTLWIRLIGCY